MSKCKFQYLNIAILVLTFFLSPRVFALACPNGEIYNASGTVVTFNTSPTTQLGNTEVIPGTGIELELSDSNGTVIYSETGTIEGTIISQNGGSVRLEHLIDLGENGDTMSTHNDHAIMRFPPLQTNELGPCAFEVVESISDFSGGGLFNSATATIIADGEIRFCSLDDNFNFFELSGEVCLESSEP